MLIYWYLQIKWIYQVTNTRPNDMCMRATKNALQWYIQGSNATAGDGLTQGMDWLTKTIKATKKR
jgi:hypothetical protein